MNTNGLDDENDRHPAQTFPNFSSYCDNNNCLSAAHYISKLSPIQSTAVIITLEVEM